MWRLPQLSHWPFELSLFHLTDAFPTSCHVLVCVVVILIVCPLSSRQLLSWDHLRRWLGLMIVCRMTAVAQRRAYLRAIAWVCEVPTRPLGQLEKACFQSTHLSILFVVHPVCSSILCTKADSFAQHSGYKGGGVWTLGFSDKENMLYCKQK